MGFLSPQKITEFQKRILTWYAVHKRDLPWRSTRDPYKILVSEVMSQQTQISRVIPKYTSWIETFPTVQALAAASVRDVLKFWSGLGYNRRALFLQKCAQVIVGEYQGSFPNEEHALLQLPGIGKYTARALLCFAFDQQVAVVDTNIKKVILTQLVRKQQLSEKEIEAIAEAILPKGKAYEWNQALMDYAAQELKREKIVIPKQSKFKDSDRYIRGQIIKKLLQHETCTLQDLQKWFALENQNTKRIEAIVASLLKEKLIQQKGNVFYL